MSDSLWPHGLQHTRPPCPSPSPGVCPSSCSLHQWCHPAISSSDAFLSLCLQSFPASGTFPVSQLFTWDDQTTAASASASILPKSIQSWFPLRLTGLISLLTKGLSEDFSSTTVQRHQSFMFCLLYGPGLTTLCAHWEDHSLDYMDRCWQNDVSAFQHTIQDCYTFPARSNHLPISGCRHYPQGF